MECQLKIAVCDDMDDERQKIVRMIEKYIDIRQYVVRIDEYESGEQLLSSDVTEYELVLLDIFMDALNGIETAKKLNEKNPGIGIIFCSTSNDFAAESYDVEALRYLIKPVSEEKLFHTLDIYFHAHKAMGMLNYKQNRMDESIYISDVLWIEAGDHKSIIHTKNGDITTSTVLKQLAEQLTDYDFVKPIRYALVSLAAVVEVPDNALTLCDGTKIPVARGSRADMKKAFTDYKMKMLLRKGGIR